MLLNHAICHATAMLNLFFKSAWQHGMELLAHVWGSPEANEGMEAFLEKRKPNFMQFRMKNKKAVDQYLDDFNNNRNQTKPE